MLRCTQKCSRRTGLVRVSRRPIAAMPSNQTVARVLAASFLAGVWDIDELTERGTQLLGRKYRWLRPLVERVCRGLDGRARPRRAAIAAFLLNDARFVRACDRHELELHDFAATKPTMLASLAPLADPVPPLDNTAALADWLEIDFGQLDWMADRHGRERRHAGERLRNYRYRVLRKRSGGFRLIEAPKPRLKEIQRRILAEILDRPPAHDAAHGFRRGRSIRSFALPHVGRRVVLRLDLRDFFPSISVAHIQALFRALGYPEAVAELLAGLCSNSTPDHVWHVDDIEPVQRPLAVNELRLAREFYADAHLPQGAPTSPALANLCAYRLDARLSALAAASGASYTRYADDLAFSGDREFERSVSRFALHVSVVAAEEGFAVNHRKTRVMRAGVRQHLAGVVVNRKVNLARSDFDRLKAVLTNAARHGLAAQNRNGHADFRAHLLGRIAMVAMLNPERGAKLHAIFDRIEN